MSFVVSSADFLKVVSGKPYAVLGQGPEAYNCGGLVRACQRDVFGRDLPITIANGSNLRSVVKAIKESELRTDWHEAPAGTKPKDGDIVAMSHAQHEHHVGVWLSIDGGGVLHAIQTFGVCFDTLVHLRVQGFRRIVFYRFVGGAA
jgi:cell wall-associated NlpC family hydrolase